VTTMTVLKFATAEGAQPVENRLLALHQQRLIQVQGAACLTWPQGDKMPRIEQLRRLAGQDALTAAGWQLLLELIFTTLNREQPVQGYCGAASSFGIEDNFIKQTRRIVTEGTSALFVLTHGPVQDKVVAALEGQSFEIISTNLSQAHDEAWRKVFGAGATSSG
jgi:uncharacterized membrane protein